MSSRLFFLTPRTLHFFFDRHFINWFTSISIIVVVGEDIKDKDTCYKDEEDPNGTSILVNKHKLTEYTAYMLYGVYHIVMVAIMLNMLIAMMSNTLSRIQVGCHGHHHAIMLKMLIAMMSTTLSRIQVG